MSIVRRLVLWFHEDGVRMYKNNNPPPPTPLSTNEKQKKSENEKNCNISLVCNNIDRVKKFNERSNIKN